LAAAIVRKFGVDFEAAPAQMQVRINAHTHDQSGARMPGNKQNQAEAKTKKPSTFV
jgi:hypothetical protein